MTFGKWFKRFYDEARVLETAEERDFRHPSLPPRVTGPNLTPPTLEETILYPLLLYLDAKAGGVTRYQITLLRDAHARKLDSFL